MIINFILLVKIFEAAGMSTVEARNSSHLFGVVQEICSTLTI